MDRDRAEVIGVAAVVFATLGQWFRLDELIVPGVGIREGVLRDLVARPELWPGGTGRRDSNPRIFSSARHTAIRFGRDLKHTKKVRNLAVSLFDQMHPIHGLGPPERLLLELGAILHDVGHIVAGKGHHKHGEYLVSQNRLPGLSNRQRRIVACLVRYHTKKKPSNRHALYSSLSTTEKEQVRKLSALLRIAERLDTDHQSAVEGIRVSLRDDQVILSVQGAPASIHTLAETREKTDLFEDEFGIKVVLAAA